MPGTRKNDLCQAISLTKIQSPNVSTERIDFISHSEDPPEVLCSFFWSEGSGVRCTNECTMREMEIQGIGTPPEGARVFPRDGRKFFDALKWSGSSYVEVTPARVVPAAIKI